MSRFPNTDDSTFWNRPVVILALIEAERLLIKIGAQVEGLDAHVGALDRAFQQAPKILNAVRVHGIPDVLNGMVDDFVLVVAESPR